MKMDINRLSGGALAEKVNIELQKLADNVMDPNTNAKAARTVTVTITVKPDENRKIGTTEINVKSTLAPARGIPTAFVFDFDRDGNAVMKELITHDPNQMGFDNEGDVVDGTGGKVVNGNFR